MDTQEQISNYIEGQPEPKRSDVQTLHELVLQVMPECKLWFLDGKSGSGETVCNPSIGYGLRTITYADGKTRAFYQVGLSANRPGSRSTSSASRIRNTWPEYGKKLGKASVTGYCIKFKKLSDINLGVLEAAMRDGLSQTSV